MTQKNRTRDMTVGAPMKLILSFAAPLLFGLLFQQFYSFVDTAIVGKYLGAEKLAAVGGTGSINFLVLGFCQGACSGFAIPIAQAFGARDEHRVRKCVAASAYLSAGVSIVMAVMTGLMCPAMLRLMNTPEEIINDSVAYIRIIFLGIPVTILYNMASGVLRSLGDSRTPVVFLILASLINVVLDLVLIIYVGMGVVMKKQFPILRMNSEELRPDGALMKSLLLTGLPMGLQFSITAVGSVIVQWSVNGLGVESVAAVAAGGKLSMFFSCVFDALATTMATYSGQNMGAGRIERITRGLKSAALIGTVYCICAYLVILIWDRSLLGIFVDAAKEPTVMAMASRYIRINSSFYIALLFVNIVRLSIQGMGYTRVAMGAGAFEMAARTAVALLIVPGLGFTGASLANPAAWVMADLFLFPCYFRCLRMVRERMQIPSEKPQRSFIMKWKKWPVSSGLLRARHH